MDYNGDPIDLNCERVDGFVFVNEVRDITQKNFVQLERLRADYWHSRDCRNCSHNVAHAFETAAVHSLYDPMHFHRGLVYLEDLHMGELNEMDLSTKKLRYGCPILIQKKS